LVHFKALTKGKFVDEDRRKHSVVPMRFVRACRRGHIGDIDWHGFVHGATPPCRRELWIDERGTTGDLGEVSVRCACGTERSLSDTGAIAARALGGCDGARPWLGPMAAETCSDPNRLLIRHASNAYFPQLMSVISIPEGNEALERAIDQTWAAYLQFVQTPEQLAALRALPPVQAALGTYDDATVWQALQARKSGQSVLATRPVKQAEIETLTAVAEELGEDRPEGLFYARALPRVAGPEPWLGVIERIVLVHRLREVIAEVGFTRFEALAPDKDGELDMGVQRASLTLQENWLPAVENKGEGFFLQLRTDAVRTWMQRPTVTERCRRLVAGFNAWRAEHSHSHREFPGPEYVLLHSLSHLLITAVSLECGYPASSIRERVYAGQAGYGILLYTGSPDAEGTLGGLVEAGRRIDRHLRAAFEIGALCSNDPVCAQHAPDDLHESRFLHGAACHGCLLIAETSCEQFNDFLDRALVLPTVERCGAELFASEAT
jgi:hypothetical protein